MSPCLSERERDVLRRRLRGEQVKAIAHSLRIAIGTVAEFQRRALVKLGVEELEDAAAVLSENVSEDAPPFRQTAPHERVSMAGMSTGPELRDLRRRLGLSARAVADEIGVSPSRVRRIEEHARVRPEACDRYCSALRRAGSERAEAVRALFTEEA